MVSISPTLLLIISGAVALLLGAGAATFFYRRKKPLTQSLKGAPSSSDILRSHEPTPAETLNTAPSALPEPEDEASGSIPSEVTAFVAACRGQNIPDIQIKIHLLDAGWSRELVDAALAAGKE